MLIGIDEAGRGPVLGPMVLGICVIAPEKVIEFKELGITDSKKFGSGAKGHAKRAALRDKIIGLSDTWAVEIAEPEKVDDWVERRSLNELERHMAEKLLRAVGAGPGDFIVCDGEGLFGPLRAFWPGLRAENKADVHYVSVAAASILAKWRRDHEMLKMSQKYEAEGYPPLKGGGYVNAGAIKFMEDYMEANGELPPEARKSWKWQRTRGTALPGGNILDLFPAS